MPKISEMKESKFLKQSDVGTGALMTIAGCHQHNVAKEGAEPEHKWCLAFEETDKPLVLNWINIQLCEKICGSDDTDEWVGKRIVLYVDPTVSFGGKVTGGIRVRAPKQTGGAKAKPKPEPEYIDESEVPF
jgi:hypothetical protein